MLSFCWASWIPSTFHFENGWYVPDEPAPLAIGLDHQARPKVQHIIHPPVDSPVGSQSLSPDQQRQHTRMTGALLILTARYNAGADMRTMHRRVPHFIEHLRLVKDVDTNCLESSVSAKSVAACKTYSPTQLSTLKSWARA